MSIAIAASRATASASEISDRASSRRLRRGAGRARRSPDRTRRSESRARALDRDRRARCTSPSVGSSSSESIEHVTDRDGAALASRRGCSTGRRLASPSGGAPARRPLRQHRHRLAGLAEADEAALDRDCLRSLVDGDAEQLVEIALGPHSRARSARSAVRARAPPSSRSRGARRSSARPASAASVCISASSSSRRARRADGGEDDADHLARPRAPGRRHSSSRVRSSFNRWFTIGELSAS